MKKHSNTFVAVSIWISLCLMVWSAYSNRQQHPAIAIARCNDGTYIAGSAATVATEGHVEPDNPVNSCKDHGGVKETYQ